MTPVQRAAWRDAWRWFAVSLVVGACLLLGTARAFAVVYPCDTPQNPTPCPGDSTSLNPPTPYKVDVSPLPHSQATAGTISKTLAIVFSVTGALSVLMVVIGGFRYVISQGDPQATSKAKSTIIYAIVGLLVSLAAVSIVTFVVDKV